MTKASVDPNYCKCCGLCVASCPMKCLDYSNELNAFGIRYVEQKNEEKCTGCAICYRLCPDVAITIK